MIRTKAAKARRATPAKPRGKVAIDDGYQRLSRVLHTSVGSLGAGTGKEQGILDCRDAPAKNGVRPKFVLHTRLIAVSHKRSSLFPTMRAPRFPATGDEIGECSWFANQGLRREDEARPAATEGDVNCLLFQASPNPPGRAEDYRCGPPGASRDRGHRRVSARGRATVWSMFRSVVAGRRRASVSGTTNPSPSFAAHADLHRSHCVGHPQGHAAPSCTRPSTDFAH